jgi:hypothetical protein
MRDNKKNSLENGEVREWFNRHDWKSCVRLSVPWVLPQDFFQKSAGTPQKSEWTFGRNPHSFSRNI